MNGDLTVSRQCPFPTNTRSLAKSGLDASAQDLAYLYAAYVSDKKNGTSEASNFNDAVRQHHFIYQIYKTSENFFA